MIRKVKKEQRAARCSLCRRERGDEGNGIISFLYESMDESSRGEAFKRGSDSLSASIEKANACGREGAPRVFGRDYI
jgi:hypothetical protein